MWTLQAGGGQRNLWHQVHDALVEASNLRRSSDYEVGQGETWGVLPFHGRRSFLSLWCCPLCCSRIFSASQWQSHRINTLMWEVWQHRTGALVVAMLEQLTPSLVSFSRLSVMFESVVGVCGMARFSPMFWHVLAMWRSCRHIPSKRKDVHSLLANAKATHSENKWPSVAEPN